MSPFLGWGDFHARPRFARSTFPEEKWGITRSLGHYGKTVFLSSENNEKEVRVNLNYPTERILQFSIGSKAARDIVNQIAHVLKSRGSMGNNKHGG